MATNKIKRGDTIYYQTPPLTEAVGECEAWSNVYLFIVEHVTAKYVHARHVAKEGARYLGVRSLPLTSEGESWSREAPASNEEITYEFCF